MHGWVRGQRGGGSGGPAWGDPAHRRSGPLSLSWFMAPVVRGSSAVSPGPQGAMGRQRAPPGPCWRRLLRAGCWWLLSLCGTALRGLRGLWSLTWVGTSLGTSPHLCRLQTWRAGGAGAGELWGASAVPLVLGLWFVATGAAGGGQCVTTAPGSSAAALAPSSRGAGPWLKALCGCAHQEPWGHGDSAPGSALHRAGVSRPLPQVLLICYKSCWDGAFQVTEEVTPPVGGPRRSPTPGTQPSPVTWPTEWHEGGSPDRDGARGHLGSAAHGPVSPHCPCWLPARHSPAAETRGE